MVHPSASTYFCPRLYMLPHPATVSATIITTSTATVTATTETRSRPNSRSQPQRQPNPRPSSPQLQLPRPPPYGRRRSQPACLRYCLLRGDIPCGAGCRALIPPAWLFLIWTAPKVYSRESIGIAIDSLLLVGVEGGSATPATRDTTC